MIIYDNIKVPHQIEFGKIHPTDSWNQVESPQITPIFSFWLSDFPKGDYPSGGNSGRISPSEIAICKLTVSNYNPVYDVVFFKWYRNFWNGSQYSHSKLLLNYMSEDYKEDTAELKQGLYSSWDYSFIGNFKGELDKAGCYSCELVTPWGDALIRFKVI